MSVNEVEQYYHEDNFGYLVVETFDNKCCGFNLKCPNECATAKKIDRNCNVLPLMYFD
jgi:hypothetical protein